MRTYGEQWFILIIGGNDYITTTTHYDVKYSALVFGVLVEVMGSCRKE